VDRPGDPRLPEAVYRTDDLSIDNLASEEVKTFWQAQGVEHTIALTLSIEAGLWTLSVARDEG
jgi:hypothetical protein